MPKPFITVKKVILAEGNKITIEDDTIAVDDIKSFRRWKKNPAEVQNVESDMTVVSVKSVSASEGFYNIRIAESYDSFSKRIGTVIPTE